MKIGILTLSASDNCGSLLQAYALQEVIKNRYDCKVEILNLETDQSKEIYELFPKKFYKHPKKSLFTLKFLKSIKRQKLGYAQFRSKYLNLTEIKYKNSEELSKIEKNYDILIAGSDQIWNIYMADYSEAFFLPWKGTAKKISYAASLGAVNKIDDTNAENIKKWLKDFNMVSVREDSGANTLEKLTDKKIQVTLDPTLLLSTSDWNRITGVRMINKPYIFYYSWAYPDEKMNEVVHRFAKEKNLEVYVINSSRWYKYRPEKFEFTLYNESGPIVFLNLMKYAEYVFVQSFHGTVFANIFQKRFFFLNEKESGEIDFRSRNLIELLHEEKQVVHSWDDVVRALTSNIEYSNDEFLDKLDKSYQFLDKAILEKENE